MKQRKMLYSKRQSELKDTTSVDGHTYRLFQMVNLI